MNGKWITSRRLEMRKNKLPNALSSSFLMDGFLLEVIFLCSCDDISCRVIFINRWKLVCEKLWGIITIFAWHTPIPNSRVKAIKEPTFSQQFLIFNWSPLLMIHPIAYFFVCYLICLTCRSRINTNDGDNYWIKRSFREPVHLQFSEYE